MCVSFFFSTHRSSASWECATSAGGPHTYAWIRCCCAVFFFSPILYRRRLSHIFIVCLIELKNFIFNTHLTTHFALHTISCLHSFGSSMMMLVVFGFFVYLRIRSPSLSTSLCLPTRYLMHFFGDNFRCAAHLKRRNKSEEVKKNFTQSRNLLHCLAVIDSRLAVRLRLNFGNLPFTSIVWIKSIMYFYFLFIEKELFIMFHML